MPVGNTAAVQLKNISELGPGWGPNGDEAVPDEDTIAVVWDMLQGYDSLGRVMQANLMPDAVTPKADGQVVVEWVRGQFDGKLTIDFQSSTAATIREEDSKGNEIVSMPPASFRRERTVPSLIRMRKRRMRKTAGTVGPADATASVLPIEGSSS